MSFSKVIDNNYIEFNDELWRIIAKEIDGTYKIIRSELLPQNEGYTTMAYDEKNHRTAEKNTYCISSQLGCGVFASIDGTFKTPDNQYYGTVTEDSSIKEYLNTTYYNSLTEEARQQVSSHNYDIGAVEYLDENKNDSVEKNIAGEKMYQWNGYVGLASVSDLLKASISPSCTSATEQYSNHDRNLNYLLELPNETGYWLINAFAQESRERSYGVWAAVVLENTGWFDINHAYLADLGGIRPVLYLSSDIILSGTGTSADPFTIMTS